jgi:hypothetical protein
VSGPPPAGGDGRSVSVRFDGFGWEALSEESARLRVPVQDLIVYAVMYYLADLDSGRIARRPPAAALRRRRARAVRRIRRRG